MNATTESQINKNDGQNNKDMGNSPPVVPPPDNTEKIIPIPDPPKPLQRLPYQPGDVVLLKSGSPACIITINTDNITDERRGMFERGELYCIRYLLEDGKASIGANGIARKMNDMDALVFLGADMKVKELQAKIEKLEKVTQQQQEKLREAITGKQDDAHDKDHSPQPDLAAPDNLAPVDMSHYANHSRDELLNVLQHRIAHGKHLGNVISATRQALGTPFDMELVTHAKAIADTANTAPTTIRMIEMTDTELKIEKGWRFKGINHAFNPATAAMTHYVVIEKAG